MNKKEIENVIFEYKYQKNFSYAYFFNISQDNKNKIEKEKNLI